MEKCEASGGLLLTIRSNETQEFVDRHFFDEKILLRAAWSAGSSSWVWVTKSSTAMHGFELEPILNDRFVDTAECRTDSQAYVFQGTWNASASMKMDEFEPFICQIWGKGKR